MQRLIRVAAHGGMPPSASGPRGPWLLTHPIFGKPEISHYINDGAGINEMGYIIFEKLVKNRRSGRLLEEKEAVRSITMFDGGNMKRLLILYALLLPFVVCAAPNNSSATEKISDNSVTYVFEGAPTSDISELSKHLTVVANIFKRQSESVPFEIYREPMLVVQMDGDIDLNALVTIKELLTPYGFEHYTIQSAGKKKAKLYISVGPFAEHESNKPIPRDEILKGTKAEQFYKCCKAHLKPGFDSLLREIIVAGDKAESYDSLFARTENIKTVDQDIIYIFDRSIGGEGLVVYIKVNSTTGLIKGIRWRVKAS